MHLHHFPAGPHLTSAERDRNTSAKWQAWEDAYACANSRQNRTYAGAILDESAALWIETTRLLNIPRDVRDDSKFLQIEIERNRCTTNICLYAGGLLSRVWFWKKKTSPTTHNSGPGRVEEPKTCPRQTQNLHLKKGHLGTAELRPPIVPGQER